MLTKQIPSVTGALYYYSSSNGAVAVAGFGDHYKNEADVDWTTTSLQTQADVGNGSALARHLPAIADEMGIKRILAPSSAKANGRMIDSALLTTRIVFDNGLEVLRNTAEPADGCLIRPGEAHLLTAGGCAVIIGKHVKPGLRAPVRVGVTHGSVRSLLNNAASNLLKALDCDPREARFRIEFAIDSELFTYPWDHPVYTNNQQICEEIFERFGPEALPGWHLPEEQQKGRISTSGMIRSQLVQAGVPEANITLGMQISEGWPFYTTRDSDPARRARRNLSIVAHYA
ncbi:MAG TPA: hypothetical protein VG753_00250 [Candidatus Paceibacterota bacterium]|nr:hypothetical protein [Candidatus Paceibacterota bacterium]